MKKALKFTGVLLGALIVFSILAVISIVIFVNPNRFKPVIIDQVMKYTGRQLTIDGDLSWTIFPSIDVKTGHLVLNNPAGFQQKTFAEVNQATVSVKLLPLLKSRIESSGIILDGMKINLIKNANGNTNWGFSNNGSSKDAAEKNAATNIALRDAAVVIAISGVAISNASVMWQDEQTKKSARIENFSLHAKNINLMEPFPVSAAFDFVSKNLAMAGHMELTSSISLSLAQQIYSFRDLVMTQKIENKGKTVKIKTTGNVIVNLEQQTVEWDDFSASLPDFDVTGKINVTNLMAAPDVRGTFKMNTLQANKIKMHDVDVTLHFQNSIIDFAPITAKLYQGTLQAEAKITLNEPVLHIATQGKLTNIQAEPLLQDLSGADQKLKFSGVGNVDWQVITAGSDSNAMMSNLNGTSHFSFNNGILKGIDLGYFIDTAHAFINGKSSAVANSNQTNFGNMTCSAVIRNGIVSNNDFLMNAPRFTTEGRGEIDLVKQRINYQLQISVKQIGQDQKDSAKQCRYVSQ